MDGLVSITLGGETYSMSPAYAVMREIEDRTRMTIAELLECVIAQRLKIEEAALIVWFACQEAGANFSSVESVGNSIFEQRLTNPALRESLSRFLLLCLWTPAEAKKKFAEEVGPMIGQTETG